MTLKERFIERLCLLYWTWKRPRNDTTFSISTTEIHARNLLIILPSNFEDFDTARLVLAPLLERMKPQSATILVRDNFRSWLPTDLGDKILTYDPLIHTPMGLPKERLCRSVREVEADVIVDLTPMYYAFTAGLVIAAEAPLRISLDHEHASKFYNLLISPEAGRTLAECYELLLTYV